MRDRSKITADSVLPAGAAAPLVTPASARSDRLRWKREHAAGCVLLAMVTNTNIAADLIDQAIEHSRSYT